MPLASGTRLGPYEILSVLGAGGMGEVYRARDGRELYYLDLSNKMVAVDVKSSGSTFERGASKVLVDSGGTSLVHLGGPYTPYVPSPNGQRFLVARVAGAEAQPSFVTVTLNWPSSLKR